MKLLPFLGSSPLLPWTNDWSTPDWACDLSLLDQGSSQGLLELELEKQQLHAALGAMGLEGVVVDVIGAPVYPIGPPLRSPADSSYTEFGVLCLSA